VCFPMKRNASYWCIMMALSMLGLELSCSGRVVPMGIGRFDGYRCYVEWLLRLRVSRAPIRVAPGSHSKPARSGWATSWPRTRTRATGDAQIQIRSDPGKSGAELLKSKLSSLNQRTWR